MILILSQESDFSTTQIIEWLEVLGKKWIRINGEDEIIIDYEGEDIVFTLNESSFKFSEITSFWYRRGFLNVKKKTSGIQEFKDFMNAEYNSLIEFIYYRLSQKHRLDSLKNRHVNKLIVNSIARELGIKTPYEFVFNKKSDLKLILDDDKEYVTKSIYGDPRRDFENFYIYNYTSSVDTNNIKSETFFPSLIQNKISKKYELRIFYLKGKFYSMAIFTQKDVQTSLDSRRYNYKKPNRRVPFVLPKLIEDKIDSLMKKLDFDSGSIDMIVTPENEYIFLEVNPIGQFSMTSFPCNYNIEKKIAEYL
ncbi:MULTISPECIES: grasp-with-spasm system ATP-grasp peptide maturase [Flavobacterium]|uniref:Grasp-with-spasm system ATP-grasp peptide maturase n=1 Tax=Flavobacterium hankyongi TaxID=1176532 RepID=A0ABP8ZLV0_9FLAO|nr:grasp-with-spasm system ATP-grasp peptide maturase [Flavobacterium sp. N1846]